MLSSLLTLAGIVLAFAGAVLASGLGRIVGEDIRSFVPRLSERLLRAAAARLNPSCADRYLEEWLAELGQASETLGKLWFALHIRYIGVRRMAREVGVHPSFSGTNFRLIRMLDRVVAFFLLPGIVPVALACTLLHGQLFSVVECLGRGGQTIRVYLFHVPRTQFGKLIYRTRLDEFPMVLNVIRGDMTITGPRPVRDSKEYKN
jgi:hypothetical protein